MAPNRPPIKMLDHVYTTIHVVANEDAPEEPAYEEGQEVGIEYTVRYQGAKNDPLMYRVELTLTSVQQGETPPAYDVNLVVVGVFKIHADCEEEKKIPTVNIAGPTMLYSAAREFLYTLTLRGPNNPIYLPTVTFVPSPPKGDEPQPPPEAEQNEQDGQDE